MLYTYIAHEVPRYSVSEDGPIPLEVVMPPHPQQAVRLSNRLGMIANAATTHWLVSWGRRRSGCAWRGEAGYWFGCSCLVLLDPLIFGAIADERGMATWFVLAQWAW